MPSTLTWLSHDTAERDRTLRLIELFKESGTVDELGIGSIRDTFADAFFPGTSVLQTRARYLLFIPWLLERTAHQSRNPAPPLRHPHQRQHPRPVLPRRRHHGRTAPPPSRC